MVLALSANHLEAVTHPQGYHIPHLGGVAVPSLQHKALEVVLRCYQGAEVEEAVLLLFL